MQVAIGNKSLPGIPMIKNIHQIIHDDPMDELDLKPARQFITRYDLCLKTEKGENQVKLIHQAFTKWFQKVQEADSQAIIYPWKYEVSKEEILENPTDVPNTLIPLKKYVNKLFPHMSGGDFLVQVILGTDKEMDIIMQMIGWWLKSMAQGMWRTGLQSVEEMTNAGWLLFQGMWRTGLQSVEEMTNAGWLLFSTDEYDHKALVLAIWEFIGVQVALCYQDIDDRKPKEDPQTKKKRTLVKALHIKIDKHNQIISYSCL